MIRPNNPEAHINQENSENKLEIPEAIEANLNNAVNKILDVGKSEESALERIPDPIKKSKIKELAQKTKKAMFFYAKIVVVSGMMLENIGDNSVKPDPNEKDLVQRAQAELSNHGVTREQRLAYKPYLSEILEDSVDPMQSYRSAGTDFFDNLVRGKDPNFWKSLGENTEHEEDAWRFYLGLPQENETFAISNYKPSKTLGDKNTYYYKLNGFFKQHLGKYRTGEFSSFENDAEVIKFLVTEIDKRGGRFLDSQTPGEPMGNFSLTHGEDQKGKYISYYDHWNLDLPIEKNGFIGKPFEIYDRLYYNPITFEPLD